MAGDRVLAEPGTGTMAGSADRELADWLPGWWAYVQGTAGVEVCGLIG
jgi:hypothetical protein